MHLIFFSDQIDLHRVYFRDIHTLGVDNCESMGYKQRPDKGALAHKMQFPFMRLHQDLQPVSCTTFFRLLLNSSGSSPSREGFCVYSQGWISCDARINNINNTPRGWPLAFSYCEAPHLHATYLPSSANFPCVRKSEETRSVVSRCRRPLFILGKTAIPLCPLNAGKIYIWILRISISLARRRSMHGLTAFSCLILHFFIITSILFSNFPIKTNPPGKHSLLFIPMNCKYKLHSYEWINMLIFPCFK